MCLAPLLYHNTDRWVTLLNDNGVQAEFHLCPLHDPLLHRVFSDETENAYLLLLTNPVSSILKWKQNRKGSIMCSASETACTFISEQCSMHLGFGNTAAYFWLD